MLAQETSAVRYHQRHMGFVPAGRHRCSRRVFAVAAVALAGIGTCGYVAARFAVMHVDSTIIPTAGVSKLYIVDRFAYRGGQPKRGDMVAYSGPIPFGPPLGHRVVAVPGDAFAIRGGRMFLNGARLDQTYGGQDFNLEIADYDVVVNGKRLGEPETLTVSDWTSPTTVPPGCFVVLGDSPQRSMDSHVDGFLCPGRPVLMSTGEPTQLFGRVLGH